MDLEYDQKFEEMKKYIPFLESMIKRLESTNNGVKNPRKAQLDKIRSLRDLLLDKKKRMKMENLLKCEQVLVNLYAKVEQRDSMADSKEDSIVKTQKEKTDLNVVRNKLKSVVSKLHDEAPETLPEIARATNTEVVCTPGSKEPALFQRRPNKASPPRQSSCNQNDDNMSSNKRNYTRVLMSPEHKKKEWLSNSDTNTEKPLFSRRSPRRSPRRYSPSYKKERKKSSKQRSKSSQHSKDLNITLKVPEESLGSLNTKDILSRIINCSDNDVDIETLRGLRSQILGELKQTGTKDDISDLILKSYKKKEKRSKKKDEVEEGELSDSESEAIENIYGSLVVVNQAESTSNTNPISCDKTHPRKIQICLVINSDKEQDSKGNKVDDQALNTNFDVTDFEAYKETKKADNVTSEMIGNKNIQQTTKTETNEKENHESAEAITIKDVEANHQSPKKDTKTDKRQNPSQEKQNLSSTESFKPNFYQPVTEEKLQTDEINKKLDSSNFSNEGNDNSKDKDTTKPGEIVKNVRVDSDAKSQVKKDVVSEIDILLALKNEILGETTAVPIPEAITPPLHQPKISKVASAQEIVSKKRISIEKYKQKSASSVKEPLFTSLKEQSSAKDDNSKKQSLKLTEKECERFNFAVNVSPVDSSEDEDNKQKDVEFRHGAPKSPDFNNKDKHRRDFEIIHGGTPKFSESKKKNERHKDFQFFSGNTCPKSPDHEDFADTGIKPPVIIPSDPVKNVTPNAKADVDMRTLIPLISPVTLDDCRKIIGSPSVNNEKMSEETRNSKLKNDEKIKKCIPEFVKRSEPNQSSRNDSPNSYLIESDTLSRSNASYPNLSNIPALMSLNVASHMTPSQNSNVVSNINSKVPLLITPVMPPNMTPGIALNMNPNMTPSRMITGINPMMTPVLTPNARSYEMTPRPNFDMEDYTNQKHVYAPIFPTFEPRVFSENDNLHINQWDNDNTKWEDRTLRNTSVQRDADYHRNRHDRYIGDKRLDSPQIRMECPSTPNASFGRIECPSTPNPSFGRMECPPTPNPSFGRMECPPTPNPSFGRMECPLTPNPSFGRMECPPTPNASFGRMECPPTPNPSFGRMECPPTPNSSFGRMETPMTPGHSFGRSDCPMTPTHSFGRPDSNMSVFGRSDYHHKTSTFSHQYNKSQDPRLNRSSDYDKSQGRNDEQKRSYLEDDYKMTDSSSRYRRSYVNTYEKDSRNSRECMPRQESSVRNSFSRDFEAGDSYNKGNYSNENHYRREKYKCTDDGNSRRNYRAKSMTRMNSSEKSFSAQKDREVARRHTRERSIEKPISVKSHTGRSFDIDTSFNRTFQDMKSSLLNSSFDARRQRASSVGRSLRESPCEDSKITHVNTKKLELDYPNHKVMRFRRACSVGRDLNDYNIDKNFKDIKEDLRSCKFNRYDFNFRNSDSKSKSTITCTNEKNITNEYYKSRDTRVSNIISTKSIEHQIDRDPRRKVRNDDSHNTKSDDGSKYSPRKNFRDPRMRRDIDAKYINKDKYKDRDRYSSCSRHENYGIVYSNDNIAKGTILASAAGVKNFKIPKIKRPVEEKEVESQSEFNTQKEAVHVTNEKDDSVVTEKNKKVESKSKKSEPSTADTHRDMEKNSKEVVIKENKVRLKEELIARKIEKNVKDNDENEQLVDSILENSERRITRSALRRGIQSKQLSRSSNVNKLRRIKKPLVHDSDSDSNEAENNLQQDNKKEVDNETQSTENTETQKNDPNVDKAEFEKCSNIIKVDTKQDCEANNYTDGSNTLIDSFLEKTTLDSKQKNAVPSITTEPCEEQNDSLDVSFGVDDELFPDNIASESVIDNINALIADLDHDIEAPKINDFNDKFINNIVGNISSNDSLIPLDENDTNFASDPIINERTGFVIDDQNLTNFTTCKPHSTAHETGTSKVTKSNNNPERVNITQSEKISDIQNQCKDDKSNDSLIAMIENNEKNIPGKVIQNISEILRNTQNIYPDAIVSTTACDEKLEETPRELQCLTNDLVSTLHSSVPDSTNNLNEKDSNTTEKDSEESFPDSTNELSLETNVTSTHDSNENLSKEQSGASSTSADNLPRIDSISKLLSILEDKNKIKELLTLLGKDSGENEKIKKKLEKLSEIVSDDEGNSNEEKKNTYKPENKMVDNENHDQDKDIEQSTEQSLITKLNEMDHVPESKEEKSVDQATKLSLSQSDEQQCNNSITLHEESNKIDESVIVKEQKADMDIFVQEQKLLTDNTISKENIQSENLTKDELNKIIDADAKNLTFTNIKEIENKVQDDCEEVLKGNEILTQIADTLPVHSGKKIVRKSKITKKGRSKLAKKLALNKDKRVTRSEASSSRSQNPSVPKKPSRELLKLQEDIRDMFISEDILNATGIRMCRLAKLVDDKNSKGDITTNEAEPIVVLENIKNKVSTDAIVNCSEKKNKQGPKSKLEDTSLDSECKEKPKYKPGPKSKTKSQDDPYFFETESIGESNSAVDSKDQNTDSDSDSVSDSTKSFESSELILESKKKTKRKRRRWHLGVIKKKVNKTKSLVKNPEFSTVASEEVDAKATKDKDLHEIPDLNCFTDKSYCFHKNVKTYLCRLCGYHGDDIVTHYKKHHPHSEIPLSRLSPEVAKEAIEQCENMNLQAISKVQTLKYVCRFCFHEFQKVNTALETFFWHVVSTHTGEYKHLCSECINVTRCPFHLDIPPPPKNVKGQLIGYICGRCNFTQVSLENLKTHVIIRHDDEQTEVYSINLGDISRKILRSLITKANETSDKGIRVLRNTRSNQSISEPSDDRSDTADGTDGLDNVQENSVQKLNIVKPPLTYSKNTMQSKLVFENDDLSSCSNNEDIVKPKIKLERVDEDHNSHHDEEEQETLDPDSESQQTHIDNVEKADAQTELTHSTDVLDYPHFKIKITESGGKEYICCINGTDNHYKTTLLISFKKHVQLKHSENWDGYCFVCKVIVTGQGKHTFKDCLQHFLDKHMDNFPILEENQSVPIVKDVSEPEISVPVEEAPIPKPYINVRPLAELISTEQCETQDDNLSMPKIKSVVSLGVSDEGTNPEAPNVEKVYNYETAQSEVMAKKHRVVLEAMLSPDKLIQVFKCAGRFCSYTTDNAEDALLHASTHQKIGGECSLNCAYCDFDSSGNAIDLVMHVFKNYSHCSFACSKCFYRAAVSQLVYAHIKRVHTELNADKVPVFSSATVMKDNLKDDLLSRDAAVSYYVCNNRDSDDGDICQFKSYVLTKFREHLQIKHPNDEEFTCYICKITTPSSKLLAQHLKSHGLRIYQCCRCLFGADNEYELLAHASEKHPLKQPKAYLRIITSKVKGGSAEVRVLPLAVLSKSTVESTIIKPSVDKESAVKQAERSIDLEKLIGQTNLMIESMSTMTNAATIEPVDVATNEEQLQLENELEPSLDSQVESANTSAILTLLKDSPTPSNKPGVLVKVEPVETEKLPSETIPIASAPTVVPTSDDSDVVCLDSEEDISRTNIIDLSGEDTAVELNSTKKLEEVADVKIARSRLYKCSKCALLSKSEGMFKRHIISCFPNPNELMKCAFCSFTTCANKIVAHYNDNHLETTLPYICGICNGKFISLMAARKHMKLIHNETMTKVNAKTSSAGIIVQYVICADFKERPGHKRKLSSETGNKTSEPAPKLKKFGPQDVDKLPINPILDDLVYCSLCEFSTKVRLNMVRHLQLHAELQPVPRTAPVNPVPHLESNEKHFDKMVNLASSSIKTSNKTSKDGNIIAVENLPPEAASKYPKYVPDKHRYTCGAKGCSYISVNESMFKIHWETLHNGANDYHCVHCPPHQHLDSSKPLTAIRIIGHLKMHDVKLYACSSCTFYHYTRKNIEKHLREVHSGKLIIVREDGVALPPTPSAPVQSSNAPTMDLKPWQCGLCKFKSMIRPEVIEHCGKLHQSKMQYKCTYCGFRTSNIENISKHQSKQHPGKTEDVFYFYYREGSIPDEADGTARWEKQSQKNESSIKTEKDVPPSDLAPILPKPAPAKPCHIVNLDIVKKEVLEGDSNVTTDGSTEDLCNSFGLFCDPNGLKYKCSLCKVVIEDTKEAMQSHLYEELQYRKWGCAICSYKAFHKPGLQQHVQTEHGHRDAKEPVELTVDHRIEMWVSQLLEHQTAIIEKNKENLVKQKAEILRATPGTSAKAAEKPVEPPTSSTGKSNKSMAELEKLFGPFGVPNNMNYTCPKCNISARAESVMQEHLEGELSKIRWCCNICTDTFQNYHEAQFHCRSVHPGQSARPVEATRDGSLRAAWVTAVLRVQKLSMNYMPVTETTTPDPPAPPPPADNTPENSLLVVRYEEKVPTPEEQMKLNKKSDADGNKTSDESEKKKVTEFECKYCNATYKYESFFQGHVLKHYGLKPFSCPYCQHTDFRRMMDAHIRSEHPNRTVVYLNTPLPTHAPVPDYLKNANSPTKPTVNTESESELICLACEEAMSRAESRTHLHDNVRPQFAIKGSVVYRCWTCMTLHKTSNDFNIHHRQYHKNLKKNSFCFKLQDDNRSLFCSLCKQSFSSIALYRSHQQVKHSMKTFSFSEPPPSDVVIEIDDEVEPGEKRKAEDTTILPVPKRVAKKSTTKLPTAMAVARKSTTKLPFNAPCDDEEYSYYGTRPSMENLENVTTKMPFYNTFVPFSLKKLSEIIKIYPTVVVKDINRKQ